MVWSLHKIATFLGPYRILDSNNYIVLHETSTIFFLLLNLKTQTCQNMLAGSPNKSSMCGRVIIINGSEMIPSI